MRTPVLILGLAIASSLPSSVRATPPDSIKLAHRIDQHLATEWKKAGVQPASLTADAVFARRVHLDLIGRIPTVAEVRTFLEDRSADRRGRLIDRLLTSGGHSRHAATFWRRTWTPQADTPQFARLADRFEEWIAAQLARKVSYDVLVRAMITAPLGPRTQVRRIRFEGAAAGAFVEASERKPENLAANTARAFLGINLDCAQCHDHPFSRWTRKQFWQTAAFFAPAGRKDDKKEPRLKLTIPNTDRVVQPEFLVATRIAWPEVLRPDTGPGILADWTTSPKNPFFARNAVNRVWANLMGVGLVEPLDDLSSENESSHPKLLDELARAFTESGFDLDFLTRTIVRSKAYQLSSDAEGRSTAAGEARLFAWMPVRGLTGEQLYDSLRVASGLPVERDDLDPVNAHRERKLFAARFLTERAATTQRSIIQALELMNGPVTEAMTSPTRTPILASTADAPFLDANGKLDVLFLSALGRLPTLREKAEMSRHLRSGGSRTEATRKLADVFWALLNSSEFSTNH